MLRSCQAKRISQCEFLNCLVSKDHGRNYDRPPFNNNSFSLRHQISCLETQDVDQGCAGYEGFEFPQNCYWKRKILLFGFYLFLSFPNIEFTIKLT